MLAQGNASEKRKCARLHRVAEKESAFGRSVNIRAAADFLRDPRRVLSGKFFWRFRQFSRQNQQLMQGPKITPKNTLASPLTVRNLGAICCLWRLLYRAVI